MHKIKYRFQTMNYGCIVITELQDMTSETSEGHLRGARKPTPSESTSQMRLPGIVM